jgi:hypothetical protein
MRAADTMHRREKAGGNASSPRLTSGRVDRRPWIAGAFAWGVLLGLAFAVAGAATRRRRAERWNTRNVVDIAMEDSFPASDPPCWTMGR